MAIIQEDTTMNEGIKLTSYGYCMFVTLQAEPWCGSVMAIKE